jgi:hypothetical protein
MPFSSPVGKRSGNTLVSPTLSESCNMSAFLDQGLAKIPKQEESSLEKNLVPFHVSSIWNPPYYWWTWPSADGRQMISIKFGPTAGMSPGNSDGIDVHAVGTSCTITATWPTVMADMSYFRKFYTPEELEDPDTQRMLNAEVDGWKDFMKSNDNTFPVLSVVIQLPFHVIETRDAITKVTTTKSGGRVFTIQLVSISMPYFQGKEVLDDILLQD